MSQAVYEHHTYNDPQLPFLCHRDEVYSSEFPSLHWHEHLEFLHGISGVAQVSAQHYPLETGDLVVVNTGEPHYVSTDTEAVYDCLIVNASFCRENGLDVDSIYLSPYIHDPEASRLHAAACAAIREEGPQRVIHIRLAVLHFLAYLSQHYAVNRSLSTDVSSVDAIKRAVQHIRHHYSKPISLDDAAAVAGLSRYYFTREFRRVTGQSFVSYLNTLRCQQAIPLLNSGRSVTEVCYACGFRELAYFSRTFRRIIGQTPSALRKK
ncbi:MAG: helix-turn-helix transcriptional regulator [Clostridia bacterium]|nr:helix-turn-helix transcriptional regulator [Clostridia bacterium]